MSNHVLNQINKPLLKDWDPIGIKNTVEAEDEYHQYADDVYKIIQNSDSYNDLFDYLWVIETEYMDLKGDRTNTEKFAKILFREVKDLLKTNQ